MVNEKPTFLDRVFGFVRQSAKPGSTDEEIENKRFTNYVGGMDKKSDLYAYAQSAVELCEDAKRITRRKKALTNRVTELAARMKEVECFHNLSLENTEKLKEMLKRFVSVSKEKNDLFNQLTSFDRNLTYLEALEEDAHYTLDQMRDAEKKQRILRHDIGYLESEKSELEYEKERYEKMLSLLKGFSLGLVAIFTAMMVFLSYLYLFEGEDVTTVLIAMFVAMVVVALGIVFFKKQTSNEVRLNVRKQKRAIELLNKKNVVLAYYSNFLRYEYKKYRVHNSQALKTNLHDLDNYRHIVKRYDSIRHIMYKIEEEIEAFLKYNHIKNTGASIEKFSRTINLEDKRKYYDELNKEKQKTEEEIADLDKRTEDIWDLLVILNENDTSPDSLIEKIIEDYFTDNDESALIV